MKFSKKGSMQLSIEAIIILVIAMVLLGLGIAFISGFFKTGTSKLMEPFDAMSFGCDPNSNDPIKTSPTVLQLKSGDTLPVKICVYNGGSADAPKVNVGIESCVNTNDNTAKKPKLLTAPQNVKRTDIAGFGTILTAKESTGTADLVPATYICTLTAVKDATTFPSALDETKVVGRKQVTITVT